MSSFGSLSLSLSLSLSHSQSFFVALPCLELMMSMALEVCLQLCGVLGRRLLALVVHLEPLRGDP